MFTSKPARKFSPALDGLEGRQLLSAAAGKMVPAVEVQTVHADSVQGAHIGMSIEAERQSRHIGPFA